MSNPTETNILFVLDTQYAIANSGGARIYVTDDNPADATTGPGGSGTNSLSFTAHSQPGATLNFAQASLNPNCSAVLTSLTSTGNVIAPAMLAQGWSGTVLGTGTDTLILTYYCQNSTAAHTATLSFTVTN